MLKHLEIRNYALIEELGVDIASGFTVVTGETGAGKSIVMGALGLVMGARADVRAIRSGAQKCVVEARFHPGDNVRLNALMDELDLDVEDDLVLRREVTSAGKSRSFVNDTPVTLSQLKQLGEMVVDIHSQHANLLLNNPGFQLDILDKKAGDAELLADYRSVYQEYVANARSLADLKKKAEQWRSERDYMEFQFRQLDDASLVADEQQSLELEQQSLIHSEDIKTDLSLAAGRLDDEQYGVLFQVRQVERSLAHASSFMPALEVYAGRVRSALAELSDISADVSQICSDLEFDPQRKEWVDARLDKLYSLMQKHRCADSDELISLRDSLGGRLLSIDSFDMEIEALEKQESVLEARLSELASLITKARAGVAPEVEAYLVQKLRYLGMEQSRVEIEVVSADRFAPTGRDAVRILFSANKNVPLRPIADIASGGEMSRVMLALKSMIVKSSGVGTILFDEIDTGVSGDVAGRMGHLMRELACQCQVLAITHLPQIAARGDDHLRVEKSSEGEMTETSMRRLSPNERVAEIAEMLSGKNPTQTALDAAMELMRQGGGAETA